MTPFKHGLCVSERYQDISLAGLVLRVMVIFAAWCGSLPGAAININGIIRRGAGCAVKWP